MPEEFGPYVVYEQIGLGGMASVHRAEARGIAGFSRPVALKRMLPNVAANEELVRSFVREARLASHLRHANVAQTLDLGKVGDTYFIAMELVPGKNLREILSHCSRACGPMPIAIAVNIISQLSDALDYAHNLCDESGKPLGIIHRDVSPSNVIVSEGGVVKLIDFGIAKASTQTMQTATRTIKGKFSYMAPEYVEGQLDARADLFALGVVAHELLANKPLFQGRDEMDTLERVCGMKIEPPSASREVPPEIDAIVMTALERDPNRRWQSAHALRTALTTEAQRLGLVALGAQVEEWMIWAFQQKADEFQVATLPGIAIGSPETTSERTDESPAQDATRPSSPHPRVVARKSQSLLTPPPPFDDQRTVQHRPSSPLQPSSSTNSRSTVPTSPRGEREPLDTLKTPTIASEEAWLGDDVGTTSPARRRSNLLSDGPLEPPTEPPTRGISAVISHPEVVVEASPSSTSPTPRPDALLVSGARTAPRLAVDAPIGDVLADLDERSSIGSSDREGSAASTRMAPKRRRHRGLMLAILVLLVAAGTAAVVYFALPYFT